MDSLVIFEPRRGKPVFAGLQITGAEQPAHLCSLISTVVKRLLENIVSNRPQGNSMF